MLSEKLPWRSRWIVAAIAACGAVGCGGSTGALMVTADASSARPEAWSRGREVGPRCMDLAHEDELLCRADRRLMEARAGGDERTLACYVRKGRELRTAYRMAEDTRARLASGESTIDRERLVYAERLIERSFVELEACNGPLDGEGDSVKVEKPADLPGEDG